MGSTRTFVESYILFTCITNQILALCTIHPRSVDGLEKLFEDSGKKVPLAHAQRVFLAQQVWQCGRRGAKLAHMQLHQSNFALGVMTSKNCASPSCFMLHYQASPLSSLVNIPPPLARMFSQQHPKAPEAYVARGGFWQGCRHQPDWTNKMREFMSLAAQWHKERQRW